MALRGAASEREPASSARRAWRVRVMGGTYVGLTTALLVVSWGNPLAWIIPSAIGVPVVERAAALARHDPSPDRVSVRSRRGL
jgi:hypothetical protein